MEDNHQIPENTEFITEDKTREAKSRPEAEKSKLGGAKPESKKSCRSGHKVFCGVLLVALAALLAFASIVFGYHWGHDEAEETTASRTTNETSETAEADKPTTTEATSEATAECNCPEAKIIGFNGESYMSIRASIAGVYAEVYGGSNKVSITTTGETMAEYYHDETLTDKNYGYGDDVSATFSQKVVDIQASYFGNGGTGGETFFFLLEDGTVEYLNILDAVKSGDFNSHKPVEGLKNITKFYNGNRQSIVTESGGVAVGGLVSYAQDINGDLFFLDPTGEYYTANR